MACTRLLLALLFAVVVAVAGAEKRYDGYGLYRVEKSYSAGRFLGNLKGIDWWRRFGHKDLPGDVMVPKGERLAFEGILATKGLRYRLLSDDVQKLILAEKQSQTEAERKGKGDGRISFDKYLTYDEMTAYLDDVAQKHADIATVEALGKSFEGRDLKGIKLSKGGSGKPSVIVDGGIHAREWIASSVALYLIQQLTEGDMTDQLDSVDWLIFPMINPDGYEYSRSEDRMWRKTRSETTEPTCMGVDANRNFDFHWMEDGASDQPCSDIYAGEKPFSESEARALAGYISENKATAKAYLTLHSYGSYILYPWGYDTSLPPDWEDLNKLGNEMKVAIAAVHGTEYKVGSSGQILYTASGASDDWAKGVANVKYVYTVELPGESFVLPASEIIPVCQETMEGIKAVGRQVAKMQKN